MKKQDTEQKPESEQKPEIKQDDSTPAFTMNDLQTCGRIIEVACSRGAFQANELTNVGIIYDKIMRSTAKGE